MTYSQYLLGTIQIWQNFNEHHYYLTSTKSCEFLDTRKLFSISVAECASFSHQAKTLKTDLLQLNVRFF